MKHKVGWDLARILHRSAPGSDKRERKLFFLLLLLICTELLLPLLLPLLLLLLLLLIFTKVPLIPTSPPATTRAPYCEVLLS